MWFISTFYLVLTISQKCEAWFTSIFILRHGCNVFTFPYWLVHNTPVDGVLKSSFFLMLICICNTVSTQDNIAQLRFPLMTFFFKFSLTHIWPRLPPFRFFPCKNNLCTSAWMYVMFTMTCLIRACLKPYTHWCVFSSIWFVISPLCTLHRAWAVPVCFRFKSITVVN